MQKTASRKTTRDTIKIRGWGDRVPHGPDLEAGGSGDNSNTKYCVSCEGRPRPPDLDGDLIGSLDVCRVRSDRAFDAPRDRAESDPGLDQELATTWPYNWSPDVM